MRLQKNTSKLNKFTHEYYLMVPFSKALQKKIDESAIDTKL